MPPPFRFCLHRAWPPSSYVRCQLGCIATVLNTLSLETKTSGPPFRHVLMSVVKRVCSFIRAPASSREVRPPYKLVLFIREKRGLTALHLMNAVWLHVFLHSAEMSRAHPAPSAVLELGFRRPLTGFILLRLLQQSLARGSSL